MSLDDKKKIRKEKFWDNMEKKSRSGRPIRAFSTAKAIIACDPELAFKAIIPLSAGRESTSEPLERVELENLLAQAIGKIFNHYRREASLVLGVDELDTILTDSKVFSFEVDKHKVINPLGFKPKEIRAVMEMTFTGRGTFERIKNLVKKTDLFFTEKGHAQATAMKKIDSKKSDFLRIGPTKSHFYARNGSGGISSRRELKWSTGGLAAEISRRWGLSDAAARNVYKYYAKKNVSPPLDKYLTKIFSKPVKELANHVKKMKTATKVHVSGEVPISLIGKNIFYESLLEGFSEKSGFAVEESDFGTPAETFRQLAPFLEFYYDNSDSEINSWLKRRLHWLGSAS